MNDLRQAIQDAIHEYGFEILQEPKRLVGLVLDAAELETAASAALESACDEGFFAKFADLLQEDAASHVDDAVARAVDYLSDEHAIDSAVAKQIAAGIAEGIVASVEEATSAEATNATGQNIQNILKGDCEIAIAMQDAVMQAYTASGAYEGKEPASDLRALMRLWPNYVQLVTTANTGIKSVEDLRGKRVGVGAANSGVEINARMILAAYGITYDDITPDYLAYGEAIDNMKNGQCDAVFVTSGLPNATVMELGVSYDMVVVPIDGEGREKLVSEYPYYAKSVIPANTYNNKEDVEGVFVYNIMLVRKDLPDEMVYDMLTGIFQNISTIKASHNAANKNIDITFGVDDIQLPLHPGAEEFWKDNGYINK